MEKRLVFFLMLSLAIIMANAMVVQMIWPPPKPAPPAAQEQPVGGAGAGDKAGKGQPVAATKAKPAPTKAKPAPSKAPPAQPVAPPPTAAAKPGTDQPKPPAGALPAPQAPERRLTLGSLDPSDGYRMLVILTSRGAAIERLALSSHRYTSLEDRSGYLGPLDLEDLPTADGCRVRVVGRGTPAAEVGLAAGDVIIGIGPAGGPQQPIASTDQLRRFFEQTRPRQKVTLVFTRDGKQMRPATVALRRRPLEVMRPERENLMLRDVPIPPGFQDPPSLLVTLQQLDDQTIKSDQVELPGIHLRDTNWEVAGHKQDEITFRRVVPAARLELIKRYRLASVPAASLADRTYPGYGLTVDLEIRNLGSSSRRVAYRLDGPTGLPVEGWWYANKIGRSWGGVGLRDMVVRYEGGTPTLVGCSAIVQKKVKPMGQGSSLMFVGVDAQYFSSVLIPQKRRLDRVWFDQVRAIRADQVEDPNEDRRLANVTCRAISKVTTLEPGSQSLHHQFTLFAGPKMPRLLAKYGQQQDLEVYNLKDLVYYGWFSWVAKPMLAILHAFYLVVRNYGIAIILLTVLVRGGMFPLSLKQTRNMQKMQELQPEIKRIAEKYKNDMEKRTKAQQDLFRAHNYNPMGGCLVMFVQLPIFLGLYRSLMVDVELRQAPLLGDAIRWCSNLAAPDMLWNWTPYVPEFISRAHGIFGLGPYLNVLPLVTVGLFILQQKMFMPPAADEQAAMQQKIMKYMMAFMGILFFKVASGLCLYFIASSAWGLAERRLLPKTVPPATAPRTAASQAAKRGTSNGNSETAGKKKRGRQPQRKR